MKKANFIKLIDINIELNTKDHYSFPDWIAENSDNLAENEWHIDGYSIKSFCHMLSLPVTGMVVDEDKIPIWSPVPHGCIADELYVKIADNGFIDILVKIDDDETNIAYNGRYYVEWQK